MRNISTIIKSEFTALDFDENWSFAKKKYRPYSHNYHRYPAKFIRPLAHKLIIDGSNQGDLVCDPFGGCGTTLLEAKILGRESIGFDINPVAKLITEVKNNAINPQKLNTASDRLHKRIANSKLTENDYDVTHKRIQYWFTRENYLILSHIHQAILQEKDEDIQKFFFCAFSHCLKNGSKWLMKSIKPTIDKQKPAVDIIKVFFRHVKGMVGNNQSLYEHLKNNNQLDLYSAIYLEDITKLNKKIQADLIVTSPPYVTSYEYGDLHQLTLVWFGQKNYKNWCTYLTDFRSFKGQFIGSSIQRNVTDDMGSDTAAEIVTGLRQKNRPLANKVSVYFNRMYDAFKVMYKLLKNDKKACIVIGNTKLSDVPILNAEVALEQMLNLGFKQQKIIKRNATTNKMITPYRDKSTGKFVSKKVKNKTLAYHEEYILQVIK